MKYRKKPVVIRAMQYTGTYDSFVDIDEYFGEPECFLADPGYFEIETLEGRMVVSINDYVIEGVQGEFYPCKPDIFEATYEEVTDG